jgi:hypothetical protein
VAITVPGCFPEKPPRMHYALREIIDPAVVDIANEGFRRTSEVLAPFVALLWPSRQQQTATEEDDEFAP